MKEKILKLRGQGKTYNEIKKALGCSKGTISYHCGDNQKERYAARTRRHRRKTATIIKEKVDAFLRDKVHSFKRGKTYLKTTGRFNYGTAYKKIVNNPICYLTGRSIDLNVPRSYHLDHIQPVSKGGENTLKNMGLTCRVANLGKWDMTVEEYIELCVDVCSHNGYSVVKKNT